MLQQAAEQSGQPGSLMYATRPITKRAFARFHSPEGLLDLLSAVKEAAQAKTADRNLSLSETA